MLDDVESWICVLAINRFLSGIEFEGFELGIVLLVHF